ncbi:hypothetical protein KKE99_03935 [Patescibacteria group bacterium]|nr:hypothetical protein [Patescibacteria group bacterium]
MKIRTMLVPPEDDMRFKKSAEIATNMFGDNDKIDEKIIYNVLADYIEVSVSGLDDLSPILKELAEKYMKESLRRFVFLLMSGLKMSASIGPEPLKIIDEGLDVSEGKITMLTLDILSKIQSERGQSETEK